MSEKFDPYQAWLGIPPEEQPPNHYRLLGIRPFEEDPEVIAAAADQRVGNLHAFQKGQHAGLSLKLLNEVAVAKVCLLNPNRKAAYDRGLQESLQAEAAQSKSPDQVERERCGRFLTTLQEKDLLPANLLENLRRQIAESKKAIPAATVAQRLIDAGHLTPALAKRLLPAESEEVPAPTVVPAAAPAEPPPAQQADEPLLAPLEEQEDDLQLAPLDDEPARRRPASRRKPQPATTPEPVGGKAEPEAAGQRPVPPAAPKPPQAPPVQPVPPPAAPPVGGGSLLDEELHPSPAGPAGEVGPLDGLMAESDLSAAAAGGPLAAAPPRKGLRGLLGRPKRVGEKANVWDSSLLLIGGGALLALLILGLVLIWALSGQTGDQALQQADEDYRAGKYAQAIHKYEQYLRKFPNHSDVSIARVNRGLAKLRQKTGRGTTDWATALQKAKEVLEEIGHEPGINQAHGDLSVMLLAIAEGLAAKARQNPDRALVAQAEEALDLLKIVPPSLRRGDKIAEVEASLALSVRDITREEELGKAIVAMQKAIKAGDAQQAYQIRKDLLKRYTLLADHSRLKQIMLEISRVQRDAVKLVEQPRPGQTAEPDADVLASVALAQRTTTARVPGVDGQVVFAIAGGAAYGLDAATGEVRWRRFLGFASNGQGIGFPPIPVPQEPGGDALLVDPTRDEVLRVEGATGGIAWRHPIGERFDAQPVIADNRILVATRSGRLVMIETATGDSPGYVALPQPLHVAPAFDPHRGLVFQTADHSNLFVVSLADGRCRRVYYLGHELGDVTAPPVVVSRLLLVAVNDRVKDCTLRVLAVDEGEAGLLIKSLQRFSLPGHVDTAPLVVGRTVLVTTDRGTVAVFEISGTDEKKPLGKIAETLIGGPENLTRFALMQSGRFWIADTRFTRYDVQAARGQLVPRWVDDDDSVFQQPLVALGPAIFHVRRKAGMPGVLVSAVEMEEQRHFWQTHLAAPLPTEPMVDPAGEKITAVTSIGGLFEVDASSLEQGDTLDQPAAAVEPGRLRRPLTEVTRLGGLLAISGGEGSRQIAVIDPRGQPARFQFITLPDPLGCPPIAFAGGLLAPTKIGHVLLWPVDPRAGDKPIEPFHPRLQSGVELAWREPAVAGQYGAVLADGRTMLYRLAVQDQPEPNLAALDQVELSEPIVSPVAVVGDLVYAVDAAGVLTAFKLPKLTRVEEAEQLLAGRCVWGPRRVGTQVVMLSTDDQLLCLDGSGQLRWRAALPYGPLAGTPLETGNHYLLASTSGVVWRLDAKGAELAKIETGRPLGTGPVPLGRQLLLGGHDGTLYRVEQPQAK